LNTETLRLPKLIEKLSISRSTIYQHVFEGLLPPPIKIGKRSVIWIGNEIDQVLAARIRGAAAVEIRKLISKILAERSAV
jgi:prophage regulatory protein